MNSDKTDNETAMQSLKRWWNSVPNCPACHGTGEPTGKYKHWANQVYWKGRLVNVCHNCDGSGKV